MHKKLNTLAAAMTVLLSSSSAYAVQFDGFLTAGASWHDDKNKNRYIGSLGDRGVQNDVSFETDTRFGLQISSDIAEDMSVTAQILGTGVDGNFDAVVEWAYVDYQATDWLSIRSGKIKQPVYLVNDYVEVGFAYPWIRPPVEVYYLNNPLNTVNGIEALFQFPIGPGTLSLQPYFGSNRDDIPNTGGVGFFEAEKIRGIDVKYSGRGYTVHASKFICDVKIFGNLTDVPTAFGDNVDIDLSGVGECDVAATGFNLDIANIVVYSEYQERKTQDGLSRPFGNQESYYATFGYRVGKWLPHITFASIDGTASSVGPAAISCAASSGGCPNIAAAFGYPGVPATTPLFNFPVAIQSSVTYGLRYEMNDSAALKIEYSVVDVEKDPAKLAEAGQMFNFGLFDADFENLAPPTDKVGVASIALDVIF